MHHHLDLPQSKKEHIPASSTTNKPVADIQANTRTLALRPSMCCSYNPQKSNQYRVQRESTLRTPWLATFLEILISIHSSMKHRRTTPKASDSTAELRAPF